MLNEKQMEAVNTLKGQVLVVSCPGSGKTTVIVNRTKKIIDSGVPSEKILVITFTKEAATQMKARYEKSYGKSNVMFGTIHSICFQVIKMAYGYEKSDILLATEQWEFFGKFLRGKSDTDNVEEFIKTYMTAISAYKNSGKTIETFDYGECEKGLFLETLREYEAFKNRMGKIDFDDMLLKCRDALKDERMLSYWKNRFSYIMIDEFQDTNEIQAEIFYKLAGADGNICVVGDDDQSIYRFRAADSSIMMGFPQKYPNCKTIYMSTNYRSDKEIIKRAGMLISNNTKRFKKDFLGSRDDAGRFIVTCADTQEAQTIGVIKKINEYVMKDSPLTETAVLYRTNAENQMLITKLVKYKIPFYTTENVKDYHQDFIFRDIMTYWRLSTGQEEKGDLQRVLNHPTRYLKTEAFKNCRFDIESMKKCCNNMQNAERATLEVMKMYREVKAMEKLKPLELVTYLIRNMGYRSFITSYCSFIKRDTESAMSILDALIEECRGFETMEEWEEYAKEFAVKLQMQRRDPNKKGVCLSTFHSSKGLEWDHVILINSNDGKSPFIKAATEADFEEERRLYYVAVTRARKSVDIFYLSKKDGKDVLPSPYLTEMGLIPGKVNTQKKIIPIIR